MTEYIILALLALFAIREVFIVRERDKLLNRLMSKDYAQYRYYQDKWPGDLKEIEKVRVEDRKEREVVAEDAPKAVDLSEFEEAWGDEENSP